MYDIYQVFDHEGDHPDLDIEGAVLRLSRAIQCATVSDCTDPAPFDRLHDLMRESYPAVMAAGHFQLIGRSVLITIPGVQKQLPPALFMAHQDVVPVVKGTEDDWTWPASSGAVEDGYIWGRGTLDIKEMVFGELEAAEYLLSHGKHPVRTIILAFGEDEETFGKGAKALSDLLKSHGTRLAFLLDEGGSGIDDGVIYGAPGVKIASIDLMEKGYADLRLSVKSKGGHSSMPWGGTSLGRLSQAIAAVTNHPFPARLPEIVCAMFESLRPYITMEPLKTLVQDINANREAIASFCLQNKTLFNLVITTIAPTMITGSSAAPNVMPQNMEAVINFRLMESHSPEQVMEHCRTAIRAAGLPLADEPDTEPGSGVALSFDQANAPSSIARRDGYGYAKVLASMQRYFKDIVFYPACSGGATDARSYEQICDTCLRRSPFMAEPEDEGSVHGTNERISVRAYIQGIRTLIHLMGETCF